MDGAVLTPLTVAPELIWSSMIRGEWEYILHPSSVSH